MMLRISWVDLKEPGVSQERPGRSRSSQEEPSDAQEQLRSDQDEFQKNRKNELRNAFGSFRETSKRLAGAMEMFRFPAIR